jgi:hypothetical protein
MNLNTISGRQGQKWNADSYGHCIFQNALWMLQWILHTVTWPANTLEFSALWSTKTAMQRHSQSKLNSSAYPEPSKQNSSASFYIVNVNTRGGCSARALERDNLEITRRRLLSGPRHVNRNPRPLDIRVEKICKIKK